MLFCVWMQGKRWLVAAFLLMFHIWGKIVHVEIYSNLLIVHKWICRWHVFQTQAYIPVLQSLSLKCIASGPFKLIATLSHCVKGTTFFHPPDPRGPFPLVIFTEKSLCAENTKCLSWAVKIGPSVAVSHVNAVRKNHPATNPLLFSMLNNGWRKPMNPWANGLYSHLSAHILLTHRPSPLSSAAHILTVLCACACLSLYSH